MRTLLVLGTYISVIAGAEVSGIVAGGLAAILAHSILLPVFLSLYALDDRSLHRRLLPGLALCSLLRIISITLSIGQIPQIYSYAIVGIPILSAVVPAARVVGLPQSMWRLRTHRWWIQVFIAGSGVPLGFVGYVLLQSPPVASGFSWTEIAVAALILLVFNGIVEEAIFRGVLQYGAQELLGAKGVLVSSTVFAVMYLGSLSWPYVLFVWFVGVFFGWWVYRTRNLWGVTLAHSLISVEMLIALPLLNR